MKWLILALTVAAVVMLWAVEVIVDATLCGLSWRDALLAAPTPHLLFHRIIFSLLMTLIGALALVVIGRHQRHLRDLQAAHDALQAREEALRDAHQRLTESAARSESSHQELEAADARLRAANASLMLNEKTLRDTEEHLRLLADAAPEMIYVVAEDGTITYVNATAARALQAEPARIVGRPLRELFPPALAARHLEEVRRVIRTGEPVLREVLEQFPDRQIWIDARLVPLRNAKGEIIAALGLSQDISARKHAEERLQASVNEKVVLLKEIHHRVKNNLQVISSLLNLQSNYIRDPQDRELFKESQNRVRAMALIHEKLYQSEDLSRIPFADYLRAMTNDLMLSYRVGDVVLRIDVDPAPLTVETAIPCGLIVNELVSNALKYAFPAGRGLAHGGDHAARDAVPQIQLALKVEDDNRRLLLAVSDNGVGLPPDVEVGGSKTLGLQLVATLARQLHGAVDVVRNGGTAIRIRFPMPGAGREGEPAGHSNDTTGA